MVLQSDRVLRDTVTEWTEIGFSFLNDQDETIHHGYRTTSKDGGAYRYNPSSSYCQDRWIVWRIKGEVVELSEFSLHTTLSNNGMRLIFPNTSLLSPITVVEGPTSVSILVSTISSVHRLVFPHPASRNTQFTLGAIPTHSASIFESIEDSLLQDKYHFSYVSHVVAPSLAASTVSSSGEAIFTFSYPSSDIRVVTLPAEGSDGAITQTDMNQWSVMQRLWSGVSRKSMVTEASAMQLAIELAQIAHETYLFTVCRDARLRVWSLTTKECIHVIPLTDYETLKVGAPQHLIYQGAGDGPGGPRLAMHLSLEEGNVFKVYSVSYIGGKIVLSSFTEHPGLDLPLKHFRLSEKEIMGLYDEEGCSKILTTRLDGGDNEWEDADMIEVPEVEEDLFEDPDAFVEFCVVEFSELTLWTGLGKVGFEMACVSIETALDRFVEVHQASGDLEDILPELFKQFKSYHDFHSTPMYLSEGLLVMEGDIAIVRPNSSDVYLSGDKNFAEALFKIAESIPSEGWQLLQEVNQSTPATEVARSLIRQYITAEHASSLEDSILAIEDPTACFTDIISSITEKDPGTCRLPAYFRSPQGRDCLNHSVDEGIFDAHKAFAVLLVCLVYIESEEILDRDDVLRVVSQKFIPSCLEILNQFSLLTWIISRVVEVKVAPDDIAMLNLEDEAGEGTGGRKRNKPQTLLHHYLSSRQPLTGYTHLGELNQMVVGLIDAMYPGSPLLDLPVFLLSSQFYKELLEYYQLAHSPTPGLEHIVAQAYAATEQTDSAVEMFLKVANNIDPACPILSQFIGTPKDDMAMSLQYIIKCVALLERQGLQRAIVGLTNQAAQFKFVTSDHLPLLHSLTFKHAVEIGEYDRAYLAMASNPSTSQKHACLKRFVVVLAEVGSAERLVSYPYRGFRSEMITVLEVKARNADLRHPQHRKYYGLLFAFHVKFKMYQYAAATAYEYVLRLQNEVPGSYDLQLKGYLKAISCLELLRPQDAWILQPAQYSDLRVSVNASPKRTRSKDEPDVKQSNRTLNLITVKELRKEYLKIDSLVKIGDVKPDAVKLYSLSASEILGLLNNCGLYDQGVLLAKYHDLPPPLASITTRCIHIAQHYAARGNLNPSATEWMQHNEMQTSDELSPPERAWLYLQSKLDDSNSWENLKVVLTQMLAASYPPPFWLLQRCKRSNIESTIRMCAQYDNLKLAVQLSIGLLSALSGRDYEDYGLSHCLHSSLPPIYTPYTVFDQKKDKSSAELLFNLKEGINSHVKLVERVSKDNEYLLRDELVR